MRPVPATVPLPAVDISIADIPLLDENFDAEDSFIGRFETPEADTTTILPTTLKVRGYL